MAVWVEAIDPTSGQSWGSGTATEDSFFWSVEVAVNSVRKVSESFRYVTC